MNDAGTRATRTRALQLAGPTAVWTSKLCASVFSALEEMVLNSSRERVFILGPSHHVYLTGCALSRCTEYATPLGSLPLDLASELFPFPQGEAAAHHFHSYC